jgi:hypothetical protein
MFRKRRQRHGSEDPEHVQAGFVKLQRVDVGVCDQHERDHDPCDDDPGEKLPTGHVMWSRSLDHRPSAERPPDARPSQPSQADAHEKKKKGRAQEKDRTLKGSNRCDPVSERIERLSQIKLDEHPLWQSEEPQQKPRSLILGRQRQHVVGNRHRRDAGEHDCRCQAHARGPAVT